jgi:hypothetical protein
MKVASLLMMLCCILAIGPVTNAALITDNIDFETDTGTFNDYLGGVLTRVASGTNGVTSKSGSFHGELVMSASDGSGAYTFHTNTPPQIQIPVGATSFTQSVDVYFDVDAAGAQVGAKWILESSIEDAAQNWTEGSQFDVEKTASGWSILGTGIEVTTDGWYTFASIWSDTGVGWDRTAKIYNGSGTEIASGGSPPNQVSYANAQYVGYTWLLNGGGSLDAGFTLAIDNADLTIVPEPSGVALAFGGLVGVACWIGRRRRRMA